MQKSYPILYYFLSTSSYPLQIVYTLNDINYADIISKLALTRYHHKIAKN